MAPSADGPGTTAGETLWLALLSAAHSPLAARVWQEKTQAHELWSHISRGSAGISLGASLVILAMQLPGGIAPAVGLGDALPAALIVSMAGVAAWIVSQIFGHEDKWAHRASMVKTTPKRAPSDRVSGLLRASGRKRDHNSGDDPTLRLAPLSARAEYDVAVPRSPEPSRIPHSVHPA